MHVIKVPLSLPEDAELADEEREAERILERAREVGEEYENVRVEKLDVRGREIGPKIVQVARDLGVEAIVMGGEPPSKIRGGAIFGGVGGTKPPEVGAATEYVLKKSPCRVLLTAPPASVSEGEQAEEEDDGADLSNDGARNVGGEENDSGAG